jgi:hypothetical protein
MRYLLGDLSESDREKLEKQFLAGNEGEEALIAAENDLMDSYVRGELPSEQRKRFEERFLGAIEKREHLAVAGMLMDPAVRQKIATAPMQSPAPSWWESLALLVSPRGLAMKLAVASTALAIAATALLGVQNWRLRTELARIHSDQAQMEQQLSTLRQQLGQNLAAAKGSNVESNPAVVTAQLEPPRFLLTAGLSRKPGSGSNQLAVPPQSRSIVLMLDLGQDRYARYDVALETVEGTRIRSFEGLKSQPGKNGRRIVALTVPSHLLTRGDYVVTLAARGADGNPQTIDSYSLSVAP